MLASLIRAITVLFLLALVIGFGACGMNGFRVGFSIHENSPTDAGFGWLFIGGGAVFFIIAAVLALQAWKILREPKHTPTRRDE